MATTRAFEQLGQHPIEFSCSTQHVVALSSGEAELYATGRAAAGKVQSVQLLAEAGMHLDVKWLWTQEAVQGVRFSLKKVGTYSNVSDLTTKHHGEERLKVLMTLGRLRYIRRHGDAVPTANEGQTAVVNAVRRSQPTELDKNVLKLWSGISSLAIPGGSERRELGDGRFAERGREQHTSNALVERGSGNTSN